MTEGIIDRFEGEWAIIEYGNHMFKLERKCLPAEAREGDLIKKQADVWIVDQSGSVLRQREIDKLADELWEDK